MWMANEAMNGTLSENLAFKSTLGTTWEKILDEDWERDFKIMRMLCGDLDNNAPACSETPGQVDETIPDLPF